MTARAAWDALFLSLVAGAAFALKRHYATASAEQLGWVLAPTAALVECFTCIHFTLERGVGFMSESRDVVIAPACAGINYLVVAMLSLTFCLLREVKTPARKACFVLSSVAAAYGATLVVNATRISIGIAVARHLPPSWDALRDQVHRVEGVVVYLTSLWLLVLAGGALIRGHGGATPTSLFRRDVVTPLSFYLAVTIGVPLVRALEPTRGFILHATTVGLVAGTLAALRAVTFFRKDGQLSSHLRRHRATGAPRLSIREDPRAGCGRASSRLT